MAVDLLSKVIYLQPLKQADEGKPLPGWWGRAAHALLLDVVRQEDPALAEKLHDESVLRPFTVSTLMGRFAGGRLELERPYRLRLTAIEAEMAAVLRQAVQAGALAVGKTLELDYLPFRVVDPHPQPLSQEERGEDLWQAETSFQELSAPYLLAKESPPRRITLQFASPTTFKGSGKHIPIPLPELVFGSLLERWNAFAPIAFPPEARRYASECLAVSRYILSTRPVRTKPDALHIGAVGEVEYSTINFDRYWMSVLAVLAEYALFSGVGAVTTMGMGQCLYVSKKRTTNSGSEQYFKEAG